MKKQDAPDLVDPPVIEPLGDVHPPTLTVDAPATVAGVNVPARIFGTAADDVSVRSIAVQVDGGPRTPAESLSAGWRTWQATVSFPTLGAHTVTVYADDHAGHTAFVSHSLDVQDPSGPVVTNLNPPSGTAIGDQVAVLTFDAVDPESPDLRAVLMRSDGLSIAAVPVAPGRWRVGMPGTSTTVPKEGVPVSCELRVTNQNGLTTPVPWSFIAKDTTRPTVGFRPADGTQVPGTLDGADVTISITASDVDPLRLDSGIASVTVALDRDTPVPAVPGVSGTWTATVHVPAEDSHVIRVVATDVAGNPGSAEHRVTVALATDFHDLRRTTYLTDLLAFAGQNLVTGGDGHRVSLPVLAEALHQPLVALATTDPDVAATPVPALRIVTDALRHLLHGAPPVAYVRWALDEGNGDRAAATGLSEVDGVITGGTWVDGPGTAPALRFDGASSRVVVGATDRLDMREALTMSAWIRATGPGADPDEGGTILCDEGSYGLARFPDGTLRWILAPSSGNVWGFTDTGVVVPEGEWHHVAVTFGDGMVRTYLNGSLQHAVGRVDPIGDVDTALEEFWIGARQWDNHRTFQGDIADVALYDRALTQGEVAALVGEPLPDEQVWLDDALPAGATERNDGEVWTWVVKDPQPFSGDLCHVSTGEGQLRTHGFLLDAPRTGLRVDPGDLLVTDVWVDPDTPSRAIVLEFLDADLAPHRASWGDPVPDAVALGALPEAGRWVRLAVPARRLGLEGGLVRGVSYGAVGGRVAWDRTGRRSWRTRPEFAELPAQAYRTLLREVGTSYDELRLARTAEGPVRTALADRLGVTLAPNRPDELDTLLLPLGAVADADLNRLFGYGTPSAGAPAEPLLLAWRRARLGERWRQADASGTDGAIPVLDPDVVAPADIAPSAGHLTALRAEREAWVAEQLGVLRSIRRGFDDPTDAYAAVVGNVLAGVDLKALDDRHRAGTGVDADLGAAGLALNAFVRLREIAALAAAKNVLDEEWDDLDAILVQVLKRRRYPTWQQEESVAGIVLEPGPFVVAAPDAVPDLLMWRATWSARLHWQEQLRARRDRLAAVEAGLTDAVRRTEQECLEDLRDALVLALAGDDDPDTVATGLTQLLHLEVAAAGTLMISPVDQAVQSVQSLLFAARTRTLDAPLRGGFLSPARRWAPAIREQHGEREFDLEWTWMGSYPTWRAAMSVFMSPENLLLPTLRTDLTPAFQAFARTLDEAVPLTPDVVQQAVDTFVAATTNAADWGAVDPADRGPVLDLRPLADVALAGRNAVQARVLDALAVAAWSDAPPWLREALLLVPQQAAAALARSGQYLAALDWWRLLYAPDADPAHRETFAGFARDTGTPGVSAGRTAQWLLNSLNPHDIAAARGGVVLRAVLQQLAGCLLDAADAEFTLDTPESGPRARALYLLADEVLADPRLTPPSTPVRPPNPVLALLRMRGAVNLAKLRAGLNIAGMARTADPTQDEAGQVVVTAGMSGLVSPAPVASPSAYRFATLLARAQQLLASAGQVESAYLASLQQRDAERYSLLRARQDLELARSRVDLQTALVDVASQEEQLSELQRQRALLQRDTYDRWIHAGPSRAERAQREALEEAGRLRATIADIDTITSIAQTSIQVASSQLFSTPVAVAAGIAFGIAAIAKNDQQHALLATETTAQTSALDASWQRRSADWALARDTADRDVTVARAQAGIAAKRTGVARAEAGIAALQQTHADAAVQFLATKFTGADLYAWMSGVLGGVYAYLLQQATAVARTAERQLAFERQDTPPAVIKADYWTADAPSAAPGTPVPDRAGLTGSARLLRDLTALEQYAFDTNRRKLQLTHTFSLAALAPLEMQEFRRTGVLPFATTAEQLDGSFPGHYMRLIRLVRVSVVGLLPHLSGIRATLTSSGVSRVVVGGAGGFRTVTIRRSPETVALTSPSGSSGVFDLDVQPELLMFFEGTGLDTAWEFRMPRPANPFDLRNVADVVVSIDYTALYDRDYAAQVIRTLPRGQTGVRTYSLREDFPDGWYNLLTAAEGDQPLRAVFGGLRSDFPVHLDALSTDSLALYVVGRRPAAGPPTPQEIAVDALVRSAGDASVKLGVAQSADGVISTLSGTGANWGNAVGPDQDPVARWELDVTDDPSTRKALVDGAISDLVLAVSYQGQLPPWPEA